MCQTISVVPARSDQHVPRLDLLGGLWNAACHDQAKEGAVQYLTVAEAYRDLEQASGRLALVDRLAALLAETPDGLLPVVCYLGQGLIAPEFAGWISGWPKSSPSARSLPPPAPAPGKSPPWSARPVISAWPPSSCWL
jgi:hypothetical protein